MELITSTLLPTVVRQLQEFESPYISLKAATDQQQGGAHRIVLRKAYWESTRDDELLEDRITMNLLYVQAVNDVERGWVIANKEQRRQLGTLQQRNSKKEVRNMNWTLSHNLVSALHSV